MLDTGASSSVIHRSFVNNDPDLKSKCSASRRMRYYIHIPEGRLRLGKKLAAQLTVSKKQAGTVFRMAEKDEPILEMDAISKLGLVTLNVDAIVVVKNDVAEQLTIAPMRNRDS